MVLMLASVVPVLVGAVAVPGGAFVLAAEEVLEDVAELPLPPPDEV
jgi:hypothetical protein